jgi:phosphoglycerol geranylgeranyltransferase
MKILEYITSELERKKLHMTLLDPEKIQPDDAREIARRAKDAGTSAIMVGGSTGTSQGNLDRILLALKPLNLPLILFPSGRNALSKHADAVYFLSLMNSRSRRFIIGEQVESSLLVKSLGIEAIPIGYIIVEPGQKAGIIGNAELIPRNRAEEAVKYALTAQYFGMKFVYLEAGSGSPLPVPPGMIREVKNEIDIPLIAGGGIKEPSVAREIAKAGADIIVTGNIVEERRDIQKVLSEIISSIND